MTGLSAILCAITGIPCMRAASSHIISCYTRFLIMGKNEAECEESAKTSIMFTTKHEPGALYGIIGVLSKAKINLTKIASRPRKGKVWEYNFYLDFEGNRHRQETATVLEEIRKMCLFLKVLGTYPIAKFD